MIFQTGNPPYSSPVLIAPLAERHPDTTIVLGNLGCDGVSYADEAIYVCELNPNVVLATTGAPLPRLRRAYSAVGPTRLLFSSGFPAHDARSQLAMIEALATTPPIGVTAAREDLDLIRGGNFLRLFPHS